MSCAIVLFQSSDGFAQNNLKSPSTATTLSAILPGAGHLYAGDDIGGKIMGVYAGALTLTIIYGPWNWEEEKKGDPYFDDLAEGTGTSGTTKAIWYASAAMTSITWLYAVIDSKNAVKRYNKRIGISVIPTIKKDDIGVQMVASINF